MGSLHRDLTPQRPGQLRRLAVRVQTKSNMAVRVLLTVGGSLLFQVYSLRARRQSALEAQRQA
jgi:hypothetical protein